MLYLHTKYLFRSYVFFSVRFGSVSSPLPAGLGSLGGRFCYNGVLEASRRAEPPQWQHACSLLSQMKAEGVPPNEVCYKTAILACQAASEVGEAEALLSEMVEAGFAPQDELKANSGVVAQCASP